MDLGGHCLCSLVKKILILLGLWSRTILLWHFSYSFNLSLIKFEIILLLSQNMKRILTAENTCFIIGAHILNSNYFNNYMYFTMRILRVMLFLSC